MSPYHPRAQKTHSTPHAFSSITRGARVRKGKKRSAGRWHPPGWVVVEAGRGVLVVVVVVGMGFAVVVFAVVTRCGRSNAIKEKRWEALTAGHRRVLCTPWAELMADFPARFQLGHWEVSVD